MGEGGLCPRAGAPPASGVSETQAHSRAEAHHRTEEGGFIVIDSNAEGQAGPSSASPRVGDPGEGCSRDAAGEARDNDDDSGGGGDNTRFYRLLGM